MSFSTGKSFGGLDVGDAGLLASPTANATNAGNANDAITYRIFIDYSNLPSFLPNPNERNALRNARYVLWGADLLHVTWHDELGSPHVGLARQQPWRRFWFLPD